MTNEERAEEIIKELAENYPDRSRLFWLIWIKNKLDAACDEAVKAERERALKVCDATILLLRSPEDASVTSIGVGKILIEIVKKVKQAIESGE